jgi:hypothetical protein
VQARSVEQREKNQDERPDAERHERLEFIRNLIEECRDIGLAVSRACKRFCKLLVYANLPLRTTVAFASWRGSLSRDDGSAPRAAEPMRRVLRVFFATGERFLTRSDDRHKCRPEGLPDPWLDTGARRVAGYSSSTLWPDARMQKGGAFKLLLAVIYLLYSEPALTVGV